MKMIARAIAAAALILLAAGLFQVAAVRSEPASAPAPDCAARLARIGIAVERPAPPARLADAACAVADAVVLVSVADPSIAARRIRFPDRPTLSCAMAERFARFAGDIAAPLALGVFGKELASVSTGPGFECRPRNRQAGAKISSHAQGDAADVMSVELAGGRVLSVEKPGDDQTRRYFGGLRAAACGAFSTVLGPGSDAAHANHIHIDIERRGRDGLSKFCQ